MTRADRAGIAGDPRARHARARARARGRHSARHVRRAAPALRDGLCGGLARGARYCGTLVRRVAAARAAYSASRCTGCRSPVGSRVDPASGAAGHRSHRCRRSPTSRGSRAAECSRRSAARSSARPLRRDCRCGPYLRRHALRPALVPVAGYLAPAVATHHDRIAGGRVARRACRASAATWCRGAESRLHAGARHGHSVFQRAHRHGSSSSTCCTPGSTRGSDSRDERQPCGAGPAQRLRANPAAVVALAVIALLVLLALAAPALNPNSIRDARLVAGRSRSRRGARPLVRNGPARARLVRAHASRARARPWRSAWSRAP